MPRVLDIRMAVSTIKPELARMNLVIETSVGLRRHISNFKELGRCVIPESGNDKDDDAVDDNEQKCRHRVHPLGEDGFQVEYSTA